jgi:putative tryptophan/tyrosine transport system substrate-binding protein
MKKVMLTVIMGAVLISMLVVAVNGAPLKIGICQIVEHPALDAVRNGVMDGLTEAGFVEGTDVEYLLASAQLDKTVAISIVQDFDAKDVDLVVAIATDMAQAAVQVLRGSSTPIVYSALTAPLAYEVIVSEEDPSLNENITGVSDMIDVRNDLQLLKDLSPEIRRIGLIYNAGEPNAEELKRQTVEVAPDVGVEIVLATVSGSSEVQMAAQSLVGRVDAFFVTTDNTVVSGLDAIVDVAEHAEIPFLVADPTSLPFGPVIAAGFDYYSLGRATSTVCAQILNGTAPNEIRPITYSDVKPEEVWLNLDAAHRIGLSFPEILVEQADGIYYQNMKWERAK